MQSIPVTSPHTSTLQGARSASVCLPLVVTQLWRKGVINRRVRLSHDDGGRALCDRRTRWTGATLDVSHSAGPDWPDRPTSITHAAECYTMSWLRKVGLRGSNRSLRCSVNTNLTDMCLKLMRRVTICWAYFASWDFDNNLRLVRQSFQIQ